MKVPLCWLKDYVDFEDTVAGFADRLTFSGIEVEGIETVGADLPGVVAGRVTAVEPHPNADRLRLCTVEYGAGETMRVVCGAPNVQVGGVYPFAPVGTVLPGGFELKKAKIRGEVSMGMLCARDELGLGSDHAGLMELDPATVPGRPLNEILGPPETVFELEITPNRPDCLSILGVAREVAALYDRPLKQPSLNFAETAPPVATLTSIEVRDPVRCPRYTARVLRGVKVGPSPDWMKKRLELAGLRSINNVVDITNFVLLEYGHPLHAFDQCRLAEGRIVVRLAEPGETLQTLDGTQRELPPESLVIGDAQQPVALAGIMGGANSEISDETETVLLESAVFDPPGIRATSKKTGLATDSSYRFQRGVDPSGADRASRRACALMSQYAGAQVATGVIDCWPAPVQPWEIQCRVDKVSALLGTPMDAGLLRRIFEALQLTITGEHEGVLTVQVPTFRGDLRRDVDLMEEAARMYGLDRIPEALPRAAVMEQADDRAVRAQAELRHLLTGLGAQEIMNYTLVSEPLLDLFDPADRDAREVLPHPISADQSVLRPSLLPQMVETLGRNRARQQEESFFFETGRVFRRMEAGPEQDEVVALGMAGPVGRGLLEKRAPVTEQEMFLWMKGMVEQVLGQLKVRAVEWTRADAPGFKAGRAVQLTAGGEVIGRLGLLDERIGREFRFNAPVALAELRQAPLLAEVFTLRPVASPAVYPAMVRDFAFVVNAEVTHADMVKAIREQAPAELESFKLFDIYQGKNLQGRKSLAYSFTYRSGSGTLTDEKVSAWHDAIGQAVCRATGAEIRAA